MSWNSFPKAWKTIHVVTETFTQRRSECKFYLLHTVEYSFFIVYKRNLLFSYQLSLVICSELFFILLICILKMIQNLFRCARAKMSLSRAKNIFMPANINSIVILCNYVIYQLGGPDRNILSRYCAVSNGDKTKQTKIFEKYSFYFRKITIA